MDRNVRIVLISDFNLDNLAAHLETHAIRSLNLNLRSLGTQSVYHRFRQQSGFSQSRP